MDGVTVKAQADDKETAPQPRIVSQLQTGEQADQTSVCHPFCKRQPNRRLTQPKPKPNCVTLGGCLCFQGRIAKLGHTYCLYAPEETVG
eukprot:scaffold346_cov116-Cylindrotheca_fusiformis.AAC.34